jgi:hypothetical protein
MPNWPRDQSQKLAGVNGNAQDDPRSEADFAVDRISEPLLVD